MSEIIYRQQKECFLMIKEYGKENAIKRCDEIISDYRNSINNLRYYDREKIDLWQNQVDFWEDVKLLCFNFK